MIGRRRYKNPDIIVWINPEISEGRATIADWGPAQRTYTMEAGSVPVQQRDTGTGRAFVYLNADNGGNPTVASYGNYTVNSNTENYTIIAGARWTGTVNWNLYTCSLGVMQPIGGGAWDPTRMNLWKRRSGTDNKMQGQLGDGTNYVNAIGTVLNANRVYFLFTRMWKQGGSVYGDVGYAGSGNVQGSDVDAALSANYTDPIALGAKQSANVAMTSPRELYCAYLFKRKLTTDEIVTITLNFVK